MEKYVFIETYVFPIQAIIFLTFLLTIFDRWKIE